MLIILLSNKLNLTIKITIFFTLPTPYRFNELQVAKNSFHKLGLRRVNWPKFFLVKTIDRIKKIYLKLKSIFIKYTL